MSERWDIVRWLLKTDDEWNPLAELEAEWAKFAKEHGTESVLCEGRFLSVSKEAEK